MSYCYLDFRTNVPLNLCCPGHLSYYSPNESEPLLSPKAMHMCAAFTDASAYFLIGCCLVGACFLAFFLLFVYFMQLLVTESFEFKPAISEAG